MAKKYYKNYERENSATPREQFLKEFTDTLIKRMEEIQASGDKWKKGWMNVGMRSARSVDNHFYTGENRWYLNFVASMCYETNVWGTFNALTSLKGENDEKILINKGEHARTILKPYEVYYLKKDERENNPDKKSFISASEYEKLKEEEKELYKKTIGFQSIKVFNVEQTNLKEVNPTLYEKFVEAKEGTIDLTNAYKFKPLDELMEKQTWVCTIQQEAQNEAYFSPSRKIIVVPEKKQFENQPEFYSTLLHEMAHSTKLVNGRQGGLHGTPEYAKEELVAELTAAFTGADLGITTVIEQDNSANYLSAWLQALKEDKTYLETILNDVNDASKIITEHLEPYMPKKEQEISAELSTTDVELAVARVFSAVSQINEVTESIKPIVIEEKNKVELSNELSPNQVEIIKSYAEAMGGKFNPGTETEKPSISFDQNSAFSPEICACIIKGETKENILKMMQEKVKANETSVKEDIKQTTKKRVSKGHSI